MKLLSPRRLTKVLIALLVLLVVITETPTPTAVAQVALPDPPQIIVQASQQNVLSVLISPRPQNQGVSVVRYDFRFDTNLNTIEDSENRGATTNGMVQVYSGTLDPNVNLYMIATMTVSGYDPTYTTPWSQPVVVFGPDALQSGSAPAQTLRIGAWGDSYISGEGAPDPVSGYLPGTDSTKNRCHRSSHAFPAIVAKHLNRQLDFHACSGAVLLDYGNRYATDHSGRNPEEPAQRDTVSKQDEIGFLVLDGNNIDFASVMRYCATRAIYQPNCETTYGKRIAGLLGKLRNSDVLVKLYKDILSRMASGAKLYVVSYPRFFPVRPPGTCQTGAPLPQHPVFTRSDMVWINNSITDLNIINMRAAAKVPGVQFIDVYDVFDGHELCNQSKQAEWMNRAIGSLDENVRVQSFHPNVLGHNAEADWILHRIG